MPKYEKSAAKNGPTSKQKQFIATMGRRVCGDEEQYRAFLQGRYGVSSPVDMRSYEASDCIDILKHMEQGKPLPPRDRSKIWATIPQVNKIRALAAMEEISDESLLAFIKRQTGRNKSIWMLSRSEAGKVIIGLQKVFSEGDKQMYALLNEADAGSLCKKVGISYKVSEMREANA